jgi:2-methylisocitrate lyase-like PEP mutase family enzyme
LYAPGLTELEEIRRVVESVSLPVNVLARPGVPSVGELASVGVARVSVGGGFAFAALGALVQAAEELRDAGTYGYSELTKLGGKAARDAFA